MFTFCKARWARQKKRKENHATKVTKIPKSKRRKYGMNETCMGLFKNYSVINQSNIDCKWKIVHCDYMCWKRPIKIWKKDLHPTEEGWCKMDIVKKEMASFVSYTKVWSVEKDTKENPWLLMVNYSEIISFFHQHISLLCGSWDHQIILKK